jgi:hypothetical protein
LDGNDVMLFYPMLLQMRLVRLDVWISHISSGLVVYVVALVK